MQLLLFKNRLLKSQLIILAMICQLVMLLVKIQFGHIKSNMSNQNSLTRAQLNLVVQHSGRGGQQNKGKGAGCTATSLTGSPTGLTASSRVFGAKFEPKMVKPKKPKIGV